jgi:hypothetical protein
MMDKSAWLMVHFVLDTLNILVDISEKFQARDATVSEVILEIEMATQSLEKLKDR